MQSRVYDCAFKQSINLLVSAPTSAGKTNVALLCILRMVQQWLVSQNLEEQYEAWVNSTDAKKPKKFQFTE